MYRNKFYLFPYSVWSPLCDAQLLSTAGVILQRTQSQEVCYSGAGGASVPYATYPPNDPGLQAIQALGQHVNQTAVALSQHVAQQENTQATRLDSVQQAAGVQAQQTYAHLLQLYQEQQLQASAQLAMNEQLVRELNYGR